MEAPIDRISSAFQQESKNNIKSTKLYHTLFNSIEYLIKDGDLPYDTEMPSTRELACALSISRSTVVQVYELLKLGDLIHSKPGSSYKVSYSSKHRPNVATPSEQHIQYPALSKAGKSFVYSSTFLESLADEETAFRPGVPPLDIFPVSIWKVLNNQYWRHVKDAEMSYLASSGSIRLRESLANYLNFTRKIKVDPKQIVVVSGSLQSIYAISTILLDPGDTIMHENPTFPNIISLFKGLQCTAIPIPIDNQGASLDAINQHKHKNTKLIHVVPSCHYPTGVRMSTERRLEIIRWASENNAVIIENDYEHEVNNHQNFTPSIFSLDTENRTFFLGTFNRLLHPSIRIGYMIVPKHYLQPMESLLRHLHRFVPNSKQMVLSQFIDGKYIYKHIQHLIQIAKERKDFFTSALTDALGEHMPILPSETDSLHILAEIPQELSDKKLVGAFRNNQIAVHAYSKTFVDTPARQGLIFGYTPVQETEMRQKIKKMTKIFLDYKRSVK